MGKILYPVGTEVQLRDWVVKKEGLKSGKRTVLSYNKGAEHPYRLSVVGSATREGDFTCAVDEIKRYRETVDDLWGATAPAVDTNTNALTKDEVERLVAEAVSKALGELEYRFSETILAHSLEAIKSAADIAEGIVHDHLLEEDQ